MGKFLRMALLFASFFTCASAMAQGTGTAIKGTVSDDKGVTLPGVTVAVKGGNVSTVTNINGLTASPFRSVLRWSLNLSGWKHRKLLWAVKPPST